MSWKDLKKDAMKDAEKSLRKIKVSDSLQGNFYFVATKKDGGLVVTLTARDPKGSMALSKGKPLRKALAGSKFARGVVKSNGPKLVFERHGGNASSDMIKKAFKQKYFSGDDGIVLLKKAIVTEPGETVEATDAETDAETDAAEEAIVLSAEELAELAMEEALQKSLGDLNGRLNSFLSAEEISKEELEQKLEQKLEQIDTLLQNEADDAEVKEARRELAQLMCNQPLVFPEPPEEMSLGDQQALQSALSQGLLDLSARLRVSVKRITEIKNELSEMTTFQRAQVSASYEAELKLQYQTVQTLVPQIKANTQAADLA